MMSTFVYKTAILNTVFSFFFLFTCTIQISAQKKEKENTSCRFEIKADESIRSKELIVSKIGISGLSIKHTDKVKKQLQLFTDDKLTIDEAKMIERFSNICSYKSWYLATIEFTVDENAKSKYRNYLPVIVQFRYNK